MTKFRVFFFHHFFGSFFGGSPQKVGNMPIHPKKRSKKVGPKMCVQKRSPDSFFATFRGVFALLAPSDRGRLVWSVFSLNAKTVENVLLIPSELWISFPTFGTLLYRLTWFSCSKKWCKKCAFFFVFFFVFFLLFFVFCFWLYCKYFFVFCVFGGAIFFVFACKKIFSLINGVSFFSLFFCCFFLCFFVVFWCATFGQYLYRFNGGVVFLGVQFLVKTLCNFWWKMVPIFGQICW